MSKVTQNPPLACYYIALVSRFVGWSERALHFAFLLPALVLVLGTYHLARRFTDSPQIAAAAVLLTPGFLVSATSVMCDTMMVALWVVAAILWIEHLEPEKPAYLVAAAFLIAVCALTKYYGGSLILLLFAYSLARLRRLGSWVWYLSIPLLILLGYQFWTRTLYGAGALSGAVSFARSLRHAQSASGLAMGLVGSSFLGGCMLTGLTFAPVLWSRKQILIGSMLTAIAAFPLSSGWLNLGITMAPRDFHERHVWVGVQLAFCIAGGISILALAIADTWKRRDADSLFLLLWVFGTFVFAGFLNWVTNARSILPLLPAAGILLVRRLDAVRTTSPRSFIARRAVPLVVAGILSIWITWGDADLANSERKAATLIAAKTANRSGTVWFEGHWGFQYYMESFGARPIDLNHLSYEAGDSIAFFNNFLLFEVRPEFLASRDIIEIEIPRRTTTLQPKLGAGFYSSEWGPLPFAIGTVPPERYYLVRLARGSK